MTYEYNGVQFPLKGLENPRELLAIYTVADNPPSWMLDAVYKLIGWKKEGGQ